MSRRTSGRRAHKRSMYLALALLPAMGFAGCKGGESGGSPARGAGSGAASAGNAGGAVLAGTSGNAAAVAADRAVLQAALADLPADTHLAFATMSPSKILKMLDYAGIRTRHAALFDKLTAEMMREIGMDLLLPTTLETRFGIDLDGPMVFAMLRFVDPRGAIGFRLKNREQFMEGVSGLFEKAERRKPAMEPIAGDGTWIPFAEPGRRSEAGLLVQKDRAWLILQDRSDAAVLAWDARRIAEVKPETGLSGQDDFKAAMKSIVGGGAAIGYLSMPRAIATFISEASGGGRVERIKEKIAARQAGLGDASELPELEADLRRQQSRSAENFAASAAVSVAVQSVVGGMSAVGFGFDVSADAIQAQVSVNTSDVALVQRLSNDGPPAPHLFALGLTPTTGAFSLALDTEGALGLARQANLVSGGRVIENLTEELKRETDLDLLTEVVPNLSGAVALQMYLQPRPPAKEGADDRPRPQVDFRLAVGVKDAKVAQPLVDRWIAAQAGDDKPVLEDGRPTLDGPDGRRLGVALVGSELVISNLPDTFALLAKPADTHAALLQVWPDAKHPHSALGQVNWPQIVLTEEEESLSWQHDYEPPVPDNVDAKAYEALRTKQRTLRTAYGRDKLAELRRGLEPFGALVGRLDTRGERADLRLVQRLNVSPAKAVDAFFGAIERTEEIRRAYYKSNDALSEEERALEPTAPEVRTPEETRDALIKAMEAPAHDTPAEAVEEDDGKE